MAFRDDLEALAAKHEALRHELQEKEKEVADSATLLAEARARLHLPVLDHVHVAKPCNADWNQMQGDDRVRTCGLCDKQVYNLSELTRAEAEALLIEHAGGLCVRYYRRADGTILLADCEVGQKRYRKRRWLAAAAAAGALGAGGLIASRASDDSRQVMGAAPVKEAPAPVSAEPSSRPKPPPAAVMGAVPPLPSCPTMPPSEQQLAAQYIREQQRALGRKLTRAERQQIREEARADVKEDLRRHAACH